MSSSRESAREGSRQGTVKRREHQTIVVSVAVWWVRTPIPLQYVLHPQDLNEADIVSRAKFRRVVNIRVHFCTCG
jgi:hypothetical protein